MNYFNQILFISVTYQHLKGPFSNQIINNKIITKMDNYQRKRDYKSDYKDNQSPYQNNQTSSSGGQFINN